MEQDNTKMHEPGADRTKEPKSVREANENIRRGQGDDATEAPRSGNRPRLDRDR
jgi:hypothetical protein